VLVVEARPMLTEFGLLRFHGRFAFRDGFFALLGVSLELRTRGVDQRGRERFG
jgi:hypothetical protein